MRDIVDPKPKRKLRGRPFRKGNPGRPHGARNKTTVAYEQLLEGQGEAIVRKVAELALAGNPMALRLAFERLMGSRRERSVDLELPPLLSASDCATAAARVLAAVASGVVTPTEGLALTQIVDSARRAFEASEYEERITAVEEALVKKNSGELQEQTASRADDERS